MELIDTHAHLDYPEFDADRDEVVRRAAEAGVTRIISIGTSLEGSRRVIALTEKYEGVFASVGIHPNDCEEAPDDAMEQLRALARHPKVVAIGETGLDYHYLPSKNATHLRQLAAPRLTIAGEFPKKPEGPDPSDLAADVEHKSRQATFFRGQLDLALELNKPVIIHQRDSFDDITAILENYRGKGKLRGVFHCFGENRERAEKVLALGFHISFTGILTFKNATALREVAAVLPLDRVMVETDSPFLTPHPFRGKRCESAHVRITAEQLAQVKGVALEEIARVTTGCAEELFFRRKI